MTEYLFRVSIKYDIFFKGKRSRHPVYAVARDKDKVKEYVSKHLKKGASIKSIQKLGERLGTNMFHSN